MDVGVTEHVAGSEFKLAKWRNAKVAVLGNRLTRALEGMYREEFSITQIEWRVIALLAEFAPMSVKELAERIAVEDYAVTRAVGRLGKRGYLSRRVDRHDRRRVELRLTKAGREVFSRIAPVALAIEREVFGVLSTEELQQLDHIIRKLELRVEEALVPGRPWTDIFDPR